MDIAELTIDEEFRKMIPPLSEVERNQLEQNLLQDGCREPLVVWAVRPTECWNCEDQNLKCSEFQFDIHNPGDEYLADYWSWQCKTCDDFSGEPDFILLDGHNRFEICQRNGIKFDVCYKLFETREQAADWIDANQLGRRNLSPEQMSLLRGRRYNRTKQSIGAPEGNQNRSVQLAQNDPIESTAQLLAEQNGVSAATIKRDGKFAEAVEVLGMEDEVLSGEVSAPKAAIVEAAKPIVEAIKAHEKWEEEAKVKPLAVPPEPPLPTADDIQKAKAHVSHNSGQNEWYTPPEFIESARNVFSGKIDCDPASCEIANATVQALVYYTKEDDGLSQKWRGNVWMNPPYAQPLISQFSDAVADKYLAKEIKSAIVLVNNATETAWFQRMVESSTAICFPKARIKFMDPQGNRTGAPLQGQAILYMGSKANKFVLEFCKYGFCVLTTEFKSQ
jgi:ParB family chromosome partitioning protein